MQIRSMLNSFAQILETHAMGIDAPNHSDVIVTGIEVQAAHLCMTLEANDGTVKTFLIEEV